MKSNIKNITVTKTELAPLSEYERLLAKIWDSHWVTNNGSMLLALEKKLKKLFDTEHLLIVSNGTLAMQLALKTITRKNGEIITTPFTFQATTNVILWEGYTPVFADIDPETFNIDPDDIERRITPNTVAIMAVHVYGNACNIERINQIAKKYDLSVIYDSAHAFDVLYKGRQLAGYGDVSTLSFHATKTFHTIEGGAIICKDKNTYERLKLLRNFGIKSEEEVISCGINAKMNEFQAAMGILNLRWLKKRFVSRKKVYEKYHKFLIGIPEIALQKMTVDKENYSYLPILLPSKDVRDYIYDNLKKMGIGTRKYFYPLTSSARFFKISEKADQSESTPVARSVSDRVLCLPMYASLKFDDVDLINREFYRLLRKILPTKINI